MLPIALSIAGSDSGGGAGIQADLKTFAAFGTFGTTAITAVTVQNTMGVRGFHAIPAEIVRAQIAAVAEDLPPRAVKSGMLATAELVTVVAAAIREHGLPNYVLDPVMVATSGDPLLAPDAEESIRAELLPLAAVVTPNLDEAAILAGFPVRTVDEMRRAAEVLVSAGAGAVLLKGGHLAAHELVDVLYDGRHWREWTHARVQTTSTHGTGCTLSAAIAAGLAHGRPLEAAVEDALDYVHRAIVAAPGLGRGHGPLNHLVGAAPRTT
ncbi:MAG TPA: bifunctional hydroxymethylpyrimidine kinase/phosphomethylpyrimidine kinase [Longimicrobiaceae bacterium]|nr:bifunctional hydroxymethylpyrimidine kinase/phosphomethylpyrimidine kinase [Longimicrobiaceae bacterium]